MVLIACTLTSSWSIVTTIRRGVPDPELYHWWYTMCTGHSFVLSTADGLQEAPVTTENVQTTLDKQAQLFAQTAQELEILPFHWATPQQREGRRRVLVAFHNAHYALSVPLQKMAANPSTDLATVVTAVDDVYTTYASLLGPALSKIGAGSLRNMQAIRQIPQCRPFL